MGRSNHDAGRTVKCPDCVTEAGRRHEPGIEVYFDPVGCEYRGCCSGEQIAVDAGIIADSDGSVFEVSADVVCESLACLGNGMDVHPVCAGTDDTSEPACPEGKVSVKGVFDCSIIHIAEFVRKFFVCHFCQPSSVF